MKIAPIKMMPAPDADYPWMIWIWFYPTYDPSEPTIAEIDAWCEPQWQHGAQYVQTTGGWRFKQESDAQLFLLTWS